LTITKNYLPDYMLESMVIVAGWTLVEFREAKWLYRVKRDEFFVWAASFVMTLESGLEYDRPLESSLYFANCERVAQFIEREMVRLQTLGITTHGVVLDCFHMNDMDATTIQVLSDTQEKLAVRGVRFAISNAKSRLYDMLAATNLLKRILANDPTISVEDAVRMMRELPPLDSKLNPATSGTSTANNPV
ncbi:Sulfate Permease (SulP) Family, partial [Phytophthora palmivora]